MAKCAERLIPLVEEEVEKFEKGWDYGKIPKSFLGIFHYIATAKLFGNPSLAQEGYDVIGEKMKDLESRMVSK